ncbi:antibiotic biosynthesis monooxygenase family protein [Algicella marina]|uniref:Antibiotic biosynthesis monooxygenase n=1 Tax=Algicella marina TaxID=2683284 RepID=A0A6P1T6Y0_9RHOB|nr:antibiotic biosynthesis monooxygenase [Algicella marina]QHQ37039.1 antibiotic biosynthesis monooxygenase [Algicella marina]
MTYIAMNRFQVLPDQTEAFEQVWASRDSQLAQVPGFVSFRLLRGPAADDHVLYASHTVWENEQVFTDWTKSEAFRKAHAGAGQGPRLTTGHPRFEGFATVLEA